MEITNTYFYCKKCNKGIDSKIGRCEDCGKRFNGKKISRTYTKEQIDELIQQSIQEMEAEAVQEEIGMEPTDESIEDGEMLCPACGKRYDITHSICTCGTPLLQDYEDAVEITEAPVQSDEGEVYGEILEHPTWKLKVRRYRNYLPEEGTKEILINRNITAVGRVYLALNHIFSYNVKADQDSIVNVSKFNAVFIEEDGRLYVQYDNLRHKGFEGVEYTKKAPIYINGRKLEEDQRQRLTAGDSVTMGNGADLNMNLCVEFIIQNRVSNAMWEEGSLGRMETLMSEFSERMDYNVELQKQILDSSKDIKQNITKLSRIQIDEFASVKSYLQSLQNFETSYKQEDESMSAQDYVDVYLKGHPDAEKLLSCLNVEQKKYLSSAAFFDYMMEKSGDKDMDCSGMFIYLGKLLESFLNNKVVDFMERFCPEQWRSKKKDRWNRDKTHFDIGDFTKTLEQEEGYNERRYGDAAKMYREIAQNVNGIKRYTYTDADQVRQAFDMINDVREIRNASAHSIMDQMSSDSVTRVDYKAYQKAKNYLLATTYLVDIADYHEIIF